MPSEFAEAVVVLERTPRALDSLLRDLPEEWTHINEGPGTFSPFEVMGHLVHGEVDDWLPRVQIILDTGGKFEPFDRFMHRVASKGKSTNDLLVEFASLRVANLKMLRRLDLGAEELARTGQHPTLGPVSLSQLLAAWVVHDLSHIRQIARVMAKRYGDSIGPWAEQMPVVSE